VRKLRRRESKHGKTKSLEFETIFLRDPYFLFLEMAAEFPKSRHEHVITGLAPLMRLN